MPLMDGGTAREANAVLMSGLYSPRSKWIIPLQRWGGFYLACCRDLGFCCALHWVSRLLNRVFPDTPMEILTSELINFTVKS